MAVRETADTYGIDVEFTQAVVTQGPIYIKAVQGGKKALCRQKIPNQIPPEDTLVLYGDMVCAWSKASNTSSYVLSNIDGPEIYISTEIPEDVVLGQIVPFERRGY